MLPLSTHEDDTKVLTVKVLRDTKSSKAFGRSSLEKIEVAHSGLYDGGTRGLMLGRGDVVRKLMQSDSAFHIC